MPLPAGFRVNGAKVLSTNQMPIPPMVQKIIAFLDKLPFGDIVTTMELGEQMGLSPSGSQLRHPILRDYREKVDQKLFWGSTKSIAKLRAQLTEPDETNGEN